MFELTEIQVRCTLDFGRVIKVKAIAPVKQRILHMLRKSPIVKCEAPTFNGQETIETEVNSESTCTYKLNTKRINQKASVCLEVTIKLS